MSTVCDTAVNALDCFYKCMEKTVENTIDIPEEETCIMGPVKECRNVTIRQANEQKFENTHNFNQHPKSDPREGLS